MKNWKSIFPKENRYYETENGILYNCDSVELLKKFPSEVVDLVLTDPPYGVNSNEQKQDVGYRDNFYDVDSVANSLFNILKQNTRCFIFTAQRTLFDVVSAFTNVGFKLHQILIWYKPNLAGGTKKSVFEFTSVYEQILNFHKGKPKRIKRRNNYNNFDILRYTQPQSNFKVDKRQHVHQKPIKLIKHLIDVSTEPTDLVVDIFAGSGTTCCVCEQLNRRWIAVEIEEGYCEIIKQRLTKIVEEKNKMSIVDSLL